MIKPHNYLVFGSDPEIFLEREGRIIGSEKLIDEVGLGAHWNSRVVQDGVQAELNPVAAGDIHGLGRNITATFNLLKEQLEKHPGVGLNYLGVVDVDQEELNSLSDKSRRLGCQPSLNIYGLKAISVNPEKYLKRSAGGHIHLGISHYQSRIYNGLDRNERARLVPLLDIFVGNLGVLIDRDVWASERRKNYGRAGEYRLPRHGLEYRTLSNFWLRNYSVMNLMFGMASFAVSVLEETLGGNDIELELIDSVDIKRVIRAIQRNDWDLAMRNHQAIKGFIAKYADGEFPLCRETLDNFEIFAWGANELGLNHYFPTDPMKHWTEEPKVTFKNFVKTV